MELEVKTQLFRILEVASRLALSRSSVYREIEAGNLKVVRIGKALRVTSDELDRYLNQLNSQNKSLA